MRKFILSLTALASLTMAATTQAQTYRFYNQFGGETGSARPDYNGGYRFYNQFGAETGSARPDYNGGYRFYNQFGSEIGSQRRGW